MNLGTSKNVFLEGIIGNFINRGDEVFCQTIGSGLTQSITWSNLEASCRTFGATYRSIGLHPGGVVLIFVRHGPELYGAFLGAMLNGLVPSFMPPISPKQNPQIYWSSHRQLLLHIKPAAIVAEAAVFDQMLEAGLHLEGVKRLCLHELCDELGEFRLPSADAIALLQHSSGTTGLKKGVALSYAAIAAQVTSYADAIALTDRDIIASWLPLYHDMGLMACLIMPSFFGVKIIHIDTFHWLARPATLFNAIMEHGGTLVWQPNFAYEHLAAVLPRQAKQFDLSRVRAFVNCSEPCKPRSFDRFAAAFVDAGVRPQQLHCCYAMAETTFAVTQTPLGVAPRRLRVDPERLRVGMCAVDPNGSLELMDVGTAIPGVVVRIFNDSREELFAGELGEVGVSGDFLFSGYYKEPTRTADHLQDGVYFTRDLGFIYEDHLYVVGRKDDLIIINGRNLYAHEIEAAIGHIEGVKSGRGLATSIFDERVGSTVLLLIAELDRRSNRPKGQIEDEIMDTISSIFDIRPRTIHLVEEGWLIKTTSGKISRKDNLTRHLNEIGKVYT